MQALGTRRLAVIVAAGLGWAGGAAAQGYQPPLDIDMAGVCSGVEPAEARRYPKRALQRRVEGLVMLDCAIGAEGALPACRTIIESPAGRGFGEAALAAACFIRVPPGAASAELPRGVELYTDADGTVRARVTVEYKLE